MPSREIVMTVVKVINYFMLGFEAHHRKELIADTKNLVQSPCMAGRS